MDPQRIAHTNRLVEVIGTESRRFTRKEDRTALKSLLFNVPGRVAMSGICCWENLIPFLKEVVSLIPPEEIGRRMKGLAVLPNGLYLNMMPTGYLMGRQYQILRSESSGRFQDHPEELAFIMDFWERTARAYRSDGQLVPSYGGATQPIIPEADVQRLLTYVRERAPAEQKTVQRMMATVELYTFILHGEARLGIFNHGPYPLGGKQVLVVRELVGLRNDFYSWAETKAAMPFSNIIRPMVLEDVKTSFDHVGNMLTTPADYSEHIVAEAALTRLNDGLRELSLEDVTRMTDQAARAQAELYVKMSEWPARLKTAYGGMLYAYMFEHFPEIAGVKGDFQRRIKESFQDSMERHVDSLLDENEQTVFLRKTIGAESPFSPVIQSQDPSLWGGKNARPPR